MDATQRSVEVEELLGASAVDAGFGNEFDIVSLYGPRGKYKITNYTEFWTRLCRLSSETIGQSGHNIPLAQKPREISSLVVDIKPQLTGEILSPWQPGFIQAICHAFQEAIRATFSMSANCVEVMCVVLTSAPWLDESSGQPVTCAHARLQFVYCVSHLDTQRRLVLPRALEILKTLNIERYLGGQLRNGNDFISIASDKPMTFYGCNDFPGVETPIFSGIWGYVQRGSSMFGDVYQAVDVPMNQVNIPGYHSLFQQGIISTDVLNYYRDQDGNIDLNFWLPLFLSLEYWTQETPLNAESPLNRPATPRQVSANGTPNYSNNSSPAGSPNGGRDIADETPIEIAQRFLQMLSKKRFLQKVYWLKIGKALYNITDGGQRGLDLWIQRTYFFLQNVEPGTEIPAFLQGNIADTCTSQYQTFFNNWYTLKTLASFACQDNVEEYNLWHVRWCAPTLARALSNVENDIAHALYRVYWLDFACASFSKKHWYYFHKHTWIESDQGVELRKLISSDFRNRFEKLRTEMSEEVERSASEDVKSGLNADIKKLNVLITSLGKTGAKNSIMSEASEFFYNANFDKYMDTNGDTYGVINGILEVTDTGITFRPGMPEDYVCKFSPIRYFPDLTWEHPLVMEGMRWLRQVYCDEELFLYVMKFFASLFRGGNPDKQFTMWVGELGNNSKSTIVKALINMHGPHAVKLPVSTLTREQFDANAASPALARTEATRLAIVQEASKAAKFNDDAVKLYTGGDSFFARRLRKNGKDITPLFKLLLVTNNIPTFLHVDNAIRERAIVVPHLSIYDYNAPADPEEQIRQRIFKRDPNFEARVPILAPYLMWAMIQYYPLYAQEGMRKIPEIVKKYTDQYWVDIDPVFQWQGEEIEVVKIKNDEGIEVVDNNCHLSLNDCYANYREWYRFAYPQTKLPNRNLLREQLVRKWGPMQGGGWYGVKFVRNPAEARNVIPSGRMNNKMFGQDDTSVPMGNNGGQMCIPSSGKNVNFVIDEDVWDAKKMLAPKLSVMDLPPPNIVGKMGSSSGTNDPGYNPYNYDPFGFVNQMAARIPVTGQ